MKPKVAIVRGKFLNKYEMQFYEPLTKEFDVTAFGSLTSYHDKFTFPVVKLPSPMDVPNVPFKMPILNRLFVDAHYLLGLEGKLKGFDIVHSAETYYHYTQQALNAKKKGYVKKVIATVLENIPHNNEGIWDRKTFKERARKDLDHIIALTEKTKAALIMEGADPKKITVIPHFIDTKVFDAPEKSMHRRGSDQKKLTILFSGRLEKYKGVLDILSAAERIIVDKRVRGYDIQFVFVGDGKERLNMAIYEKRFHLESHVLHRSVPYSQMPEVYNAADIFVAPSRPYFAKASRGKPVKVWEEQYCTALLEAQAAGLPIVTTVSGGIPENVGNAAELVRPGDVTALTEKLISFITSPSKRKQFALAARKRAVTVHDKMIGAKKLADLYRKILDE